jgi:hypothetical protein
MMTFGEAAPWYRVGSSGAVAETEMDEVTRDDSRSRPDGRSTTAGAVTLDAVPAGRGVPYAPSELTILIMSAALVGIFYYPSLIKHSQNAGYLYSGDIIGFYLPTIMKLHELVRNFDFTALDYSLYNGSSDFFLSPNFFTFHPLIILYSIVFPPEGDSVRRLGQLITIMMTLHSLVALYFTQRLFHRVLRLDFAAAMFGAVLFTFSINMVYALGQPPFFFVATVVPWICCSVLECVERPRIEAIVLASAPVVLALVGGYIPLGLGAVAFSGLVVLIYIAGTHPYRTEGWTNLLRRLSTAALPCILGVAVCGLYVLALYLFNKDTGSAGRSTLFFSAHQLAENPSAILRAISPSWRVPGPQVEFSVAFGIVPLVVAMIFVFSFRAVRGLNARELATLQVSGGLYFFLVLAIFGSSSVASDLIYYFVPQVGQMHIYQRFLLFGHLAFAAMITLMLSAIERVRPSVTIRVVFAIMALLVVASSYTVAYRGEIFSTLGISADVIVELIGAVLVLGALVIPRRTFVFAVAGALAVMPAMGRMYERSGNDAVLEQQSARMPMQLRPKDDAALVDYIKAHTGKTYVKYADLTPIWSKDGVEVFPKVFPYLVLPQIKLSSYTGVTFYLSSRADYRARMPISGDLRLNPDWAFLRESGADFVIVPVAEASGGALAAVTGPVAAADVYRLPNGAVMLPIEQTGTPASMFDNGMIRIASPQAEIVRLKNLALHAPARQSSGVKPELAVDGNTDGDYADGSVTHTGADPNAWLEIDLGSSQPIGSIRVWNRTDCCQQRLDNFWTFVSDAPFGDADTADVLKVRAGTWGRQNFAPKRFVEIAADKVSGRYVRVQLSGGAEPDNAFLHIAELQVFPPSPDAAVQGAGAPPAAAAADPVTSFKTNFANFTQIKVDLKSPAAVQYLFSDNPKLTYTVDGERVAFDVSSGVPSYLLPAGRHSIEIRYSHGLLGLFWIVYGCYWLVLLLAIALRMARNPLAQRDASPCG